MSSLQNSSSELSVIHGNVQSKEAVLIDVLHMRMCEPASESSVRARMSPSFRWRARCDAPKECVCRS